MPIELTSKQTKIAFNIDAESFRAVLDTDTSGKKTVEVLVVADGKKLISNLNPKSFRKAVAAFLAAENPAVSVSGNLVGNKVEGAGIQVFDKGAKQPMAEKPPGTAESAENKKPATEQRVKPDCAPRGDTRPLITVKKRRAVAIDPEAPPMNSANALPARWTTLSSRPSAESPPQSARGGTVPSYHSTSQAAPAPEHPLGDAFPNPPAVRLPRPWHPHPVRIS